MPAKLDYQSVRPEQFERPVHICGSKPPQRRRPSLLKLSLVAAVFLFLVLVGLVGWRDSNRLRREGERREAMAIVGTLRLQDEVVHLEWEGFQDQSVFIELKLTGQSFAEMKTDAKSRATHVSDPGTPVLSGPAWWHVPRGAEQVDTPRRTYFFDAGSRSVHVCEWHW